MCIYIYICLITGELPLFSWRAIVSRLERASAILAESGTSIFRAASTKGGPADRCRASQPITRGGWVGCRNTSTNQDDKTLEHV